MIKSKDDRLDSLIASAPRELAPATDNWQAIASRLDRPLPDTETLPYTEKSPDTEKAPRRLPLAIAAIAMLLVLVPLFNREPAPTDDGLHALIDSIELAHQQEVAVLIAPSQLAWQKVGFSDSIDAGLTELREAAKLILNALKANPQDKQLWQLWLWVQRREIELLTQGQRLPQGATQGDTL
ncbi:hypothetical protein KJI95_08705 [Shewanella sp. JM162201]|uniref:Uncharacterized protein n=1 Tax=Shewanella jiangmenensis TaxID=2837387 RepID=A0ABS5V2D4_9GAMM|nr:hypothetical protein [Shewanella jiangmenensis]MBT1444610.1 hypothetical protein [Shewanella jiangmenensis]